MPPAAPWQRRLVLPLLLFLLGLGILATPRPALAWGPSPEPALAWPRRATPATPRPSQAQPGPQEVPPPEAVQQLRQALAPRQPRITILSPADGAFLDDGPWELKLRVEDWPLVDAGPLGLGPHLMRQLDDQPPEPLLSTSATLPALAPGSHRLTVYAVRPWDEVVKAPGAFQQIRLHRVAANPLALPVPGSPQLLTVSPGVVNAAEPLLLDWLLIDAPLQNLRSEDTRWRLRVTVNGDSFLVQNQTPLWLQGWRPGSNAVLLELVDARGEPLNPPFNSLVREVRLEPGAARPAWLGPRLSPGTLAQLLGEAPPPAGLTGDEGSPAAPETEAPQPSLAALDPGPAAAAAPAPAHSPPDPPGSGTAAGESPLRLQGNDPATEQAPDQEPEQQPEQGAEQRAEQEPEQGAEQGPVQESAPTPDQGPQP